MNILCCSVGRRCQLLKDIKITLGDGVKIVATDANKYAPALYFADKTYIVPSVFSEEYIDVLTEIIKKEKIQAITTLIDPEIEILARNREIFEEYGVEVLAPYKETARLCFDKYEMFKYLRENNIETVNTYGSFADFYADYNENKINFPVFVKPRTGSGSVGARKIDNLKLLKDVTAEDPQLIIQEYMGDAIDLDADVYVDTISNKPVSIFSKKKISTTIGGANKTISFKDQNLFDFIVKVLRLFKFNGPIDMDFFYKDDTYYLSEINPRFGGAYLHAYSAGVDFIKLIKNNIDGKENKPVFGTYDDGVVMMMYDSVVICKEEDIRKDVVIIGASGHGKVIADIVNKSGDNVIGFLDDNMKKRGGGVLGKVNDCIKYTEKEFIIAIGNNEIRRKIAEQYPDLRYYTAIHPAAVIAEDVKIGKGTAIMASAVINASSDIGEHCIINTGAVVEHDDIIGNYTHISPRAVICGTVHVGQGTHIGAGAVVRNNVNITDNVTVGAGAVVVHDIGKSGVYVGVPAKELVG